MRIISYAEAINEAFFQLLNKNKEIILIGQGITSPWYVGSTTTGLLNQFGESRIIDTPVSECAMTGIAVGASLSGLRPVVVHPRMDFMYYAMDPIANHAAAWKYMFGNQLSIPLTIWGIINRGGEQAAQHSQALHGMFAHIPGLSVILPSDPYTAKGLLMAAVQSDDPVLFIDDRWLYPYTGDVPEGEYIIPIGTGRIIQQGKHITIIASSYFVQESIRAAEILMKEGIECEIIDILSLKPLDLDLILKSVEKTGRVVIVDGGFVHFGAAAEICAQISESNLFSRLKAPIKRICLPDHHAPASKVLEKKYYPDFLNIISEIHNLMEYN